MGGAAVLVVQVVGVLPDVEGQERGKATGDGIGGAGLLGDDEGAVGGGREPDPPGAEKAHASGFEGRFEGVEGAPLFLDPGLQMPGRAGHDGNIRAGHDGISGARHDGVHGPELREIQVVVQNLASVVEDRSSARQGRGLAHDLLQRFGFQAAPRQELVQIVDIALQVLATMKLQGAGRNHRLQRVDCIR